VLFAGGSQNYDEKEKGKIEFPSSSYLVFIALR
jgi:hypothetical protein